MGKSISGFIILFVHTFLLISAIRASTDTLTPGQSIRDGDLLVSADGSFELGFFSPGISKGRYLIALMLFAFHHYQKLMKVVSPLYSTLILFFQTMFVFLNF